MRTLYYHESVKSVEEALEIGGPSHTNLEKDESGK